MRPRRTAAEFSISFLDVICCGFGAVILLLMITKTVQPQILEKSTIVADGKVAELTEQLFEIRGETTILNRELDARQEQISEFKERIAILQGALAKAQSRFDALETTRNTNSIVQQQLAIARQQLSEEEKRLLGVNAEKKNQLIGGIPVDSEYIIFVIDTSGSMQRIWDKVIDQIYNAVNIYPVVKGFRIFNGQGKELNLGYYQGQDGWIKGDELKKPSTLQALSNFSFEPDDSSLQAGVEKAVNTVRSFDPSVSIYVFADDLMPKLTVGDLIQANQPGRAPKLRKAETERLLSNIRQTAARRAGAGELRIHVIAFPDSLRSQTVDWETKNRNFVNFARNLTTQNHGALVTINP